MEKRNGRFNMSRGHRRSGQKGYKAAEVREKLWLPEERLWWRVIVKALEDGDAKWFRKGNHLSDFDLICEDLDIDEEQTRDWCEWVVRGGRGKDVKAWAYGEG